MQGQSVHGLHQLLVISRSDFLNAGLPIKPLSDGLVRLDELIKLNGQILILLCDHSDMVVELVNLNLEIGVVVEESGVAVSSPLQLFLHMHDLVLLGPDFGLQVLHACG